MATSQTKLLQPLFGEGFLDDHAGRLILNPEIAIVELVANSWDAGARKVEITWPKVEKGYFEITDDGTGMTRDEFESIWPELNYNRVQRQGHVVNFPDPSLELKRSAYGRNGKGRHSMFCFSDEYRVKSWKNGFACSFQVKRSHGMSPYDIRLMNHDPKEGHGTKISCSLMKNYVEEEAVQELLGSKFITDPDFTIHLNGHKINLYDLEEVEAEEYAIPGEGKVRILKIDSKQRSRLSRLHGVAWWVNKRLVGEHSWKGIEGVYLDGRSSQAKRYTFIVEADLLRDEVKPDWTGFKNTTRANNITHLVTEYIFVSIQTLMEGIRRESKKRILADHKNEIQQLRRISRLQIGRFVDKIQKNCPTMTPRDLSQAIAILTKMELSRSGYDLLQQLVKLEPNDLDSLAKILDAWSVNDAKKVLDELQWRLELIKKLESLVENPETKELQTLQPLFGTGLWIFGPEYEGVRFTSNKSIATVVKQILGTDVEEQSRQRPDFVISPDSSIGFYSSDDYDENSEVCGISKLLIVELKRGGSKITQTEKRQALDYGLAILKSGKISDSTNITCYVLGADINQHDNKISKEGDNLVVIPRTYSTILRQAHTRTFNLLEKIKESKEIEEETDSEINEILSQKDFEYEYDDITVPKPECED